MSKTLTLSQTVDAYLDVDAQIKALEETKKQHGDNLRAFGSSVLVGSKGRVDVSETAGRQTVDYKKVFIAANVPQPIIDKYTTIGAASTRLTVTRF